MSAFVGDAANRSRSTAARLAVMVCDRLPAESLTHSVSMIWVWLKFREAHRDDHLRASLPVMAKLLGGGGAFTPLAAPNEEGGALGAWLIPAVVAAF
jgi:hypothetical protein